MRNNTIKNYVKTLDSPQEMKKMKNLQKFTPNLQKRKSSAKFLKESRERIKFIETFVKPAESVNKITFQNLKLNPVSNKHRQAWT